MLLHDRMDADRSRAVNIIDFDAVKAINFEHENDFKLYQAVLDQNLISIKALLGAGANPHARNNVDGSTAIDVLVMGVAVSRDDTVQFVNNDCEILKLLLNHHPLFPNELYNARKNTTLHTPLCTAVTQRQNARYSIAVRIWC